MSFGATLGLAIPAAAAAAAGGVTIAGSEIGYQVVSKRKQKIAQEACDKDKEAVEEVKRISAAMAVQIEALRERHPNMSDESFVAAFMKAARISQRGGSAVWSAYKLVDGAVDVGRTAAAGAKIGASGARVAWAGLSTPLRVVSVVDVVFDSVDIATMLKASYDVHQHKKGNSMSNAACALGELIKELEKERNQIRDFSAASRSHYNEPSALYALEVIMAQ